jgi:hypothetical protein
MIVSRIDITELAPLPNASVTDVKHLASYNWIEAPTPTIAVPGLPPSWCEVNTPRQLKKDSGLVYIAQNAARHPESPLEPLFRALYIEDPSFDISSVDIVSDRNNIRKLLSFIEPDSSAHGVKSFTMRMEVVNEVVILHREETLTKEFIGPDDFRGYGHEFEKAYTTSEIPHSTGHHRIVSYRFGSLRFLIRHETDGYVDIGAPTQLANEESASDDLSSLFESLSILQPRAPHEATSAGSKLTVRKEGRKIALQSTLEIKTRVHHKPLSVADVAPQLWLSQTPKLVRAYHEKGRFKIPVVEDVTSALQKWERLNQQPLGRLAALLVKLIAAGRRHKYSTIRYDAPSDRLHVEYDEGKKVLPADLYERWTGDQTPEHGQENKRDSLLSHSTQVSNSTIRIFVQV